MYITPMLKNHELAEDEIDLLELLHVIWGGKWLIIAITAVFAVGSVFYALWLPDTYRAEVLLAPAEDDSGGALSGQLGQLGAWLAWRVLTWMLEGVWSA